MNPGRYEEIYSTVNAHHVCTYLSGYTTLSEQDKVRVRENTFRKVARWWVEYFDRQPIQEFYTAWNVQRKIKFPTLLRY
jgi:hypothetical protein